MTELKKLLLERLKELVEAYGLMEGVEIWEREVDYTVEQIQQELIDRLQNIADMQNLYN